MESLKNSVILNKSLIEKYPWLYPRYEWSGEKVKDFDYTWTELDAMPDGWREAFGELLCEEIQEELEKYNFADKYSIAQIKEKFGCYDKETEVLTRGGWKHFKDLTYEDEIATLDEENDTLEYQKPIDIIAYKYDGKMYHLENRGVSLMITPNHNLYVSKGSYFNGGKNNYKRTYPFELCTPDKYYLEDKRFKKGCKWIGKVESETYVVSGYTKVREYCRREYHNSDIEIDLHSFVKFLGYYIAEGCASTTDEKDFNKGDISIGRDRSDYKKKLIDELIINIGFTPRDATDYNKNGNSGCTRFYSTVLARWLIDNCGHMAWNKKVPDFIKELPSEYIKEFLEYLYLGDGHKAATSNILYTTSKQLSDDVQELLLKAGYCFRFTNLGIPQNKSNKRNIYGKHPCYTINWLKLNDVEIDMSKAKKTVSYKEEWTDYNDYVYCVSVPNHIIYVRRNGKGVWCGNSLRWYDNGYPSGSRLHEIIENYSACSEYICINCGELDVPCTDGWIIPVCKNCIKKMNINDPDAYWEKISKEQFPHTLPLTRRYRQWFKDKDEPEDVIIDLVPTVQKIRKRYVERHGE